MYNRYIPQPDGTYRRNRMQDSQRPSPPPQQASCPCPPEATPSRAEETVPPVSTPPCKNRFQPAPRKRQSAPPSSVGSFLRQLLPGDFDTEDLLVVVLLLLMAGDCEEDRNNALLTLALYLFL